MLKITLLLTCKPMTENKSNLILTLAMVGSEQKLPGKEALVF
jgi:hypothetical protein